MSSAMVGMAGKNGRGSIELFGKDDARKLMRQGDCPERNPVAGCREQGGRQPIGSADREGCHLSASVADACKLRRKGLATERFAVEIERNQGLGIAGQFAQRHLFLGFALRGGCSAALGSLTP